MVHVNSALKGTMYHFKYSFSPNFVPIFTVKYIFSRNVFFHSIKNWLTQSAMNDLLPILPSWHPNLIHQCFSKKDPLFCIFFLLEFSITGEWSRSLDFMLSTGHLSIWKLGTKDRKIRAFQRSTIWYKGIRSTVLQFYN